MRAAVVQMDVKLGSHESNFANVIALLSRAAENGAQLVVFPECAITGYCFHSFDEGLANSIAVDDSGLDAFSQCCAALGVVGVLGFLEKSRDERHIYNSAIITGIPNGKTSFYRKTHLPTLGVDRFVTGGDALSLTDAGEFQLGTLICYDIRFAEAVRSIGLMNADILALPTNWPQGAESSPDFLTRARAWENRFYVLAANRIGTERGRRFIGRSQIVSPTGTILAEASADEEVILFANLDLNISRQKRIIIEPGEWELDTTAGRRPELYGRLQT